MVPDDDAVRERARSVAEAVGRGEAGDAADRLTEAGRERVVNACPEPFRDGADAPAGVFESYRRGLYAQYGDFEEVDVTAVDGDRATVAFRFADGTEVGTVTVEDGGVAGFEFDPAYEAPTYVDADEVREREVTVDAGDVDLRGTLALPGDPDSRETGPVPGAILVHGRGIHDPDGTEGATKLLKDLAWGLAAEGIATLRYQKRLHDHEVTPEEHTLDAVVADDAVAAASTLSGADGVAPGKLFVVGHSQGGMCAPRVARRHGDIAGVVGLDPPPRPLPDPDDLTTVRYHLALDGDLDESQAAALESHRETFRRLAAGEFDDDETLLGVPGAWYRSLRDYDPVTAAADLDAPVFVTGTGRTDDATQAELYEALRRRFEAWESAPLPDGSQTKFYDGLCHYLQAGPAPVTPSRLYFGGSVAEAVVADVADWLHAVADG